MTEPDWLYQPLSGDASTRGPVLGVRADLEHAIGTDLDQRAVLYTCTLGGYDPEFTDVTNLLLLSTIAHALRLPPATSYAAACRLETEHHAVDIVARPRPDYDGFTASPDPDLARVYQWDELPASTRANWAAAMLASPAALNLLTRTTPGQTPSNPGN